MSYKIIRYFEGSCGKRTIKTGLTLEEAKEHCKREDSHGVVAGHKDKRWFDGFVEE